MNMLNRLFGRNKPIFADEKMLVTVKVDGKESQVSVSDLVRSYQKNRAADNRLRDATLKLRAAK